MELTLPLIIFIVISGLVKGFVGFGLSLVLIVVLLQVGYHPTELLPILVPLFIVLDILLYFENRKNITLDWKENFTFHPTTLMTLFLGVLLGTYLLTVIDASLLKLIFGVLVLIVIFFLLEKVDAHNLKVPSETDNGFFGFGSGLLTGLFTLNAVPASLYLLYHQYPKEKYMGALVTFVIFSDIILVAVYLFKGLFTLEGFIVSIKLLFMVLVGFGVGVYLRRKVSSKYFKAVVIFVLAISAIKMIWDYFMN